MKIHGGYNHPNNWRNYFANCPVVLLDGRRVDHVQEADDIDGCVIIEMQDDAGRPKIDETCDTIATQRLTGRVEFIGVKFIHASRR